MAAHKRKPDAVVDGVEMFVCDGGCKRLIARRVYGSKGRFACSQCNAKSLRIFKEAQRRKRSWTGHLVRDLASVEKYDFLADGYDAAEAKKFICECEHPPGSLMWYFWLEGYREFGRPPDWDFKADPDKEQQFSMSGQVLSRMRHRVDRHRTGAERIYADDELFA